MVLPDKKKNNRKEASIGVVAAREGDNEGESPGLAPAAEPRDGGKGRTPVTTAAGGKESKRRQADNPGSHARGDLSVCPFVCRSLFGASSFLGGTLYWHQALCTLASNDGHFCLGI